ncbi:N-acetylmuramic acid 6-phosphate etherase [Virgibacillus sp. NKC19-16]|uniref:N-acetylmuramic acid 6-phosphate etherase n=1 Tax=Virgibacillus salidurans TaxID=2831673 RepID=UPI001F490377|nr:N-acetylmuramic acid 6-phosphate etherase [Virgibacillus sp. NKC19-16]UJL46106.1 N-acetylmuramic acid 6-phosphate etherase [Virgibacillus sp. NKC19-16]
MLNQLTTETRNAQTIDIDTKSIKEILQTMNQEDQKVPLAIASEIPQIEKAVNSVINSFHQGGRLIYLGAGTSGRLGILDASECPPTFGVSKEKVQGLIAGGLKAITDAVEGAEDSEVLGGDDLKSISLTKNDTVVGIAASGRTPYVMGGLKYANRIGASTVSISNNKDSKIGEVASVAIEAVTGPEVLTGSTRLKAGTAQKLVLNMITTTAMIGIGKVYQNLMVDVQATNQKLTERSKQIIMEATNADYETAADYLEKANHEVKAAIVMILLDCNFEQATEKLKESKGRIRNTK